MGDSWILGNMLRAKVHEEACWDQVEENSWEGQVKDCDAVLHSYFDVDVINGVEDAIQVDE